MDRTAVESSGGSSDTICSSVTSATSVIILRGLVALLSILLLVAVGVALVMWRRSVRFRVRRRLHNQDYLDIRFGTPDRKEDFKSVARADVFAQATVFNISDLKIDYDRIGQGHFGAVCPGSLKLEFGVVAVAVKSLARNASYDDGAWLTELRILKYLDQHPNIVTLFGVVDSEDPAAYPFIVLELCKLGSLQTYLRRLNESSVVTSPLRSNLDPSPGYQHLMPKPPDLILWCQQIASAVEFMHSKHVIHCDLATRNVLLSHTTLVKVCDFGMAKKLYPGDPYVYVSGGMFPWRWVAPEVLGTPADMRLSTYSDVWSLGVTMWEIFTLGDEPYIDSGCGGFNTLYEKIIAGQRLPRPALAPSAVYELMRQCWNVQPSHRIKCVDLCAQLKLLQNSQDQLDETLEVRRSTSMPDDETISLHRD